MTRLLARLLTLAFLIACEGPRGPPGEQGVPGPQGDAGTSCTIGRTDGGVHSVICSDGTVAPIPRSPGSLVRLDQEPAGINCMNGGTRITTGLDDNGDGELQSGEVRNTAYVCNGGSPSGSTCTTLEGSVTIHNSLEWLNLVNAGCHTITGVLTIDALGMTALAPPATSLRQVQGLRVEGNETLTSLSLPGLERVTERGIIISGNTVLLSAALPALASVGGTEVQGEVTGGFTISGNPVLAQIQVPALSTVHNGIQFVGNEALSAMAFPSLSTLTDGGLSVEGSERLATFAAPVLARADGPISLAPVDLTSLSFPSLTSAESVSVGGPQLTSIQMSTLTTLRRGLTIGHAPRLTIVQLPALTEGEITLADTGLGTLSVPQLRRGSLTLSSNQALTSVALPQLGSATGIEVVGSPALTTLSMPMLTASDGLHFLQLPQVAVSLPLLRTGGTIEVVDIPSLSVPILEEARSFSVSANVASVTAPQLARIERELTVMDSAVTTVALPLLASVGGRVELQSFDGGLTTVRLPALQSVGDSIRIRSVQTSTLDLSSLRTSGTIELAQGSTSALTLPALTFCQEIVVTTSGFPSVALPALTTVGDGGVRLYATSSVDAPVLSSVGGPLGLSGSRASALSLPVLAVVGGDFSIDSNSLLSTLNLPQLRTVGGHFRVLNNPALPECRAWNLVGQLTMYNGVTISGNSTTCP